MKQSKFLILGAAALTAANPPALSYSTSYWTVCSYPGGSLTTLGYPTSPTPAPYPSPTGSPPSETLTETDTLTSTYCHWCGPKTTVYTVTWVSFCPTGLTTGINPITATTSGVETPAWPTDGVPPGYTTGVHTCTVCGPQPVTATLTYATTVTSIPYVGQITPAPAPPAYPAPPGSVVSQIGDGQPQGPKSPVTNSPNQGPPSNAGPYPVSQIGDGQPQAPVQPVPRPYSPVSQIGDGQPQAPVQPAPAPYQPVSQLGDGQPQAPIPKAPKPTGKPVTQIGDGQPQAPIQPAPLSPLQNQNPPAYPAGTPEAPPAPPAPPAPSSNAAPPPASAPVPVPTSETTVGVKSAQPKPTGAIQPPAYHGSARANGVALSSSLLAALVGILAYAL